MTAAANRSQGLVWFPNMSDTGIFSGVPNSSRTVHDFMTCLYNKLSGTCSYMDLKTVLSTLNYLGIGRPPNLE